ncbi:hypothetical protein [Gordonia sp. (in: high G+C Gram-positive bacteria)]|uniref:hypothetical protein n=1 Tax=Gordonia sp. (in: high G+C Gram-positive bacteria) TaxID=84139 RepID=UPI00261F148C|nr:hypothetical protein [Gordonia sp. (in: high G+C Gram-positive bacteria)]
MATAPSRNATRKTWADHLKREGIDVPPGATRADLIALWDLNETEDTAAYTDRDVDPVLDQALDYKPAPHAALADQIPAELRFSTDTGERREPEKLLIDLNGKPAYLYEPPKSLLILVGAALSPETPLERKIGTMMDLLSSCLDSAAEREVRAAMFSRTAVFNEDLLGELVALIFDTWAPSLDADTSVSPPMNRAQKRAAARK